MKGAWPRASPDGLRAAAHGAILRSMTTPTFAAARARPPDAPALLAGVHGAVWVSETGEAETLSLEAAAERLRRGAVPIVCHARALARRLRLTAVDATTCWSCSPSRAPPASAYHHRAAWRRPCCCRLRGRVTKRR